MAGHRESSLLQVDADVFINALHGAVATLVGDAEKMTLETAYKVRGTAQQYAPVRTGLLRSKIEVGSVVQAGGATGQLVNEFYVEVGILDPELKYPTYVEFGTIHMPAQPFMRPALAEVTGFASGAGSIAGQHGRPVHQEPHTYTASGRW